jgi:acyl carrier protein
MISRPSFDIVKEILIEELDVPADKIDLSADLESLGIDSLAVIELLFQVEEKLGISLPDERVPLKTLGDVVTFLDRLRAQAAQASTAGNSPGSSAPAGAK